MGRVSDRWLNRIERDSRHNDKARGRAIDPTIPYINRETLVRLQQEQSNRCYYCQVPMDWLERRRTKNGLTLERLDNRQPHYIHNCVLCCKHCNASRFDTQTGILKRYFSIWKSKALDIIAPTTPRCASLMS